VPIFVERYGALESTQEHLRRCIDRVDTAHLEIETYTWDVLPDHLKTGDIVEYVTRELDWVKGQLV
jgi:hypothetical protein